jgi:hypothetical protein
MRDQNGDGIIVIPSQILSLVRQSARAAPLQPLVGDLSLRFRHSEDQMGLPALQKAKSVHEAEGWAFMLYLQL